MIYPISYREQSQVKNNCTTVGGQMLSFLAEVIKKIALATQRLFKSLGDAVVRAARYLDAKSIEGAEIQRRIQRNRDDRFAKYGYTMRPMW